MNRFLLKGMLVLLIFAAGCKKGNLKVENKSATRIITEAASEITRNTAKLIGRLESKGGDKIHEAGFCYDVIAGPTISGHCVVVSLNNEGEIIHLLDKLNPGTTYYVRAYAKNHLGIAYGNEITFKTPSLSLPTIQLDREIVGSPVLFGAIIAAEIMDDGGDKIIETGICFDINPDPTIESSEYLKASELSLTSRYTIKVEGLQGNSTYYFRSYAKNSIGTAYGETRIIVVDIEGNVYNTIKIGDQVWMKENLRTTRFNDGLPINNITDDLKWAGPNWTHPLSETVSSVSAYCWYRNDISFKYPYGAIYNGYAVLTDKLAPKGWRVPSHKDMEIMLKVIDPNLSYEAVTTSYYTTEIYRSNVAGTRMKSDTVKNWNGTNESGFSALPAGFRQDWGYFENTEILPGMAQPPMVDYHRYFTGFWTSTLIEFDYSSPNTSAYPLMYRMHLHWQDPGLVVYHPGQLSYGFPVRCLMN